VGENREKVFVMKDKPDPVVAKAAKLDHIILLLGIPARGDVLKPLVILPRLTMTPLPADILDGYHISGTHSGWINGEILKNWVENQLVDEIQQRRNKCVIILEIMQTEYGIDFLRLPPHSSAMQPLDRCPNGELKKILPRNINLTLEMMPLRKEFAFFRAAKLCITTCLSGVYAEAGWIDLSTSENFGQRRNHL
jgi:hypothetical protein